jgi:hypothetical protein
MTKAQTLSLQDKVLYHQIHPLKLAADWGSTPLSLYLLWRHKTLPALVVTFMPPLVSSWAIIRFANLAPYKASPFGRYIAIYMTPSLQALRLVGFGVMAVGAWLHRAWLIPLGLCAILYGWLRGIILPRP